MLLIKLAVAVFFLDDLCFFDWRVASLDHHVGLEVENGLELTQRDVQQVADARRQALEEPYVRARRRQLDVSQAFAANF